ncbi:MAG: hypothetical protein GXO47_00400 [Chlorobi bacterium]|nr:hypothetical protein [Chlorobiota bacterium]
MFGKRATFINNEGFVFLNKIYKGNDGFSKEFVKKHNNVIDDIISICRKKGKKLYFFTSPYYKSTVSFSYLEEYLPNYHDFSNVLRNKKEFADLTHLNGYGAQIFTNIFIDYYFFNKRDSIEIINHIAY